MNATFSYEFDATTWSVRIGWWGEERYAGVEMAIKDFALQGGAMLEAMRKAHSLAETITDMLNKGANVEDVDRMMRAIKADGGL